MDNAPGFLGSLFDFSFSSFITTQIIKVLYGLCMLGAAFLALFVIVSGFAVSTGVGVLALFIGAPLAFLVTVIYSRVMLELIIVVFRISEGITQIAQQGGSTSQ